MALGNTDSREGSVVTADLARMPWHSGGLSRWKSPAVRVPRTESQSLRRLQVPWTLRGLWSAFKQRKGKREEA